MRAHTLASSTAALWLVFLSGIVFPAFAAPGDLDMAFNPNANGYVSSAVTQPDGKVLVAGYFTYIGGRDIPYVARFHRDGTLDEAFAPRPDNFVSQVWVQNDGRVLITGSFTHVGLVPQRFLSRLRADGTVDETFQPEGPDAIRAMALLPDGTILLTRYRPLVTGLYLNRLERLQPDGSVDPGFNVETQGSVLGIFPAPDGTVYLCGSFTSVQGQPRQGVARLLADGSVDPGFVANATGGDVRALSLQPDGHVMASGFFSAVNGVSRRGLARIGHDGTVVPSFAISVFSTYSTALQADGDLLLAGSSGQVASILRYGMARVRATGALDLQFAPTQCCSEVSSVGLSQDGRILVGGYFTSVNSVPRMQIARLENGPASSSLLVTSTNRVEWLRGGTAPEADYVHFDWSPAPGGAFTPLGRGQAISGGWEYVGTNIPAHGQLRANARIRAGSHNGSGGIVTAAVALGRPSAPDLEISLPGRVLVPGESVDFGLASPGDPRFLSFSVRNQGEADLTGLGVVLEGAHSDDFEVTLAALPDLPGPSGAGHFTVRFTRSVDGPRNAILRLVSNDPDQPSFVLNLGGTAGISTEARLAGLKASQGDLRPSFRPDLDSYLLDVSFARSNLTVTPVAVHPAATISVNGTPVVSGAASASLPLTVGTNLVRVAVTAQDGVTTRTTTATVVRATGYFPGDVLPFPDVEANFPIAALAEQPDGKVVVGGSFTSILDESRPRVARLFPNGSLDAAFLPANIDGAVNAVAVQEDGGVIVGGEFLNVGGGPRAYLARLLPNGSLDPSFAPGVDGAVRSLDLQPDGKILVGGAFTTVGGAARRWIARLLPSGLLDTAFVPMVVASDSFSHISNVTYQDGGALLVGGHFKSMNGQNRPGLARLNLNGTNHASPMYTPDVSDYVNMHVFFVATQPDGSFFAGGRFFNTQLWGQGCFTRLLPNAMHDTAFVPGVARDDAYQNAFGCALAADGNVVLTGNFLSVGRRAQTRVARFDRQGNLDVGFTPNPNGDAVGGLARSDGKLLVAGAFTNVGGLARRSLVLLENGPAPQSLSAPNPARVLWLRGGALPETQQVEFAVSTNAGATYAPVGRGTRVAGGWELAGQPLPTTGRLRARARVNGGAYNGSSGLVETTADYSFLPLTGVEAWRDQFFHSPADAGVGADLADPDQDGLSNLAERAFGLHPDQDSRGGLPSGTLLGDRYEIRFTEPAAAAGLLYTAESSATYPAAGPWTPVPDTGVAPEHVFSVPVGTSDRSYIRLIVTRP